jgi:hypothetical protein
MLDSIFSSDIFTKVILPFVLVFTLIFAILEKSKLMGEDKKQINAILGLVIALILISFPYPRDIIVKLMPFLAVVAVILLVFMLLYGFSSGNKSGDPLGKGLKITVGILIALALIVFLLIITGGWDLIMNSFSSGTTNSIIFNTIFIVIIVGVIVAVVAGNSGEKASS